MMNYITLAAMHVVKEYDLAIIILKQLKTILSLQIARK